MKFNSVLLAGAAFAAVSSGAAPAMAAEVLTNGNFETGTFAGWTTTGNNAVFYLDTPGTTSPISGMSMPANNKGGSFYAVSDQTGPSIAALSQAFTVTGPSTIALNFQMTVQNRTTENLSTQYARVDIMRAGAGSLSVVPADVVRNLYLSGATTDWTNYSFDLSSLAAGSYTLRFYENDQNYFLQQGVDNVSLDITPTATPVGSVPEPATWGMMILGMGAVGFAMRRGRKVSTTLRFA